MMTVATVFYYHLEGVVKPPWAGCYTPEWVDKLYRGVSRNYQKEFKFVCLTNVGDVFKEEIDIQPLYADTWQRVCLQLHAVKADRLVLMGLDTIITGDLTEIFAYEGVLAVPRDPYTPDYPCNGVVLGVTNPEIAASKASSDMQALRAFPYEWLDDLFPGQIRSYKVQVRNQGLGDARIVYFHGEPKPHQLMNEQWIVENWK